MKTTILKVIVGMMIAAQVSLVPTAKADELEQLRAQVQVISDVLDARIYEFSRKSTDAPAFDHADYLVARQRYFANMKTGLQNFKNEVLEIYSRFEPYFKVANSTFYSAAQKNQMLYAAGGPLSLVIEKAERDYSIAFEKLLAHGAGDIYIRLLNAKSKAPYYLDKANRKSYDDVSASMIVCNSTACAKKLSFSLTSRLEYITDDVSVRIYDGAIMAFNQDLIRQNSGCATFHCFTLLKSDFNETLGSLWAEFGREERKFYFDSAKTSSFPFKLVRVENSAGLLGLCVTRGGYRNVEKCDRYQAVTINGQEAHKIFANSIRPEEGYGGRNRDLVSSLWRAERYGGTFKLVDLLFAPLVKPF